MTNGCVEIGPESHSRSRISRENEYFSTCVTPQQPLLIEAKEQPHPLPRAADAVRCGAVREGSGCAVNLELQIPKDGKREVTGTRRQLQQRNMDRLFCARCVELSQNNEARTLVTIPHSEALGSSLREIAGRSALLHVLQPSSLDQNSAVSGAIPAHSSKFVLSAKIR